MNKDIKNHNDKGQLHGYQERYDNNKLAIRINMYNGLPNGYLEYHLKQTLQSKRTTYHIT